MKCVFFQDDVNIVKIRIKSYETVSAIWKSKWFQAKKYFFGNEIEQVF